MGGWWRWTLVSPDGVAPSQMISVSASFNLPLHHKSRSSVMALAHPGGPGKRAVNGLWWSVKVLMVAQSTDSSENIIAKRLLYILTI